MTIEEAEKVIAELRKENAERRIKNNELSNDLATVTAEKDKLAKANDTLTTTLKTTQEEVVKVKEDSKAELDKISADQKEEKKLAAVKILALKEGLVDEDGLKLADLSKITLEADGSLKGATEVIAALKESKAYLFGKPGNSSIPFKKPKPGDETPVDASTMSDADYEKAKANMLSSIK